MCIVQYSTNVDGVGLHRKTIISYMLAVTPVIS